MSFIKFNHKKKEPSHHPWERVVKDQLQKNLKYAHNSINNTEYPKNESKKQNIDRVKFTIIGDQVTKEFNYCVSIANGLYKYRSKIFDAPNIRGVTTVDWPHVLNDLKRKFGGLAYCLENSVAIILNDKFLGGEKEFREIINAKYYYHIILDYYKEGVDQFVNYVRSSSRPCAYMHISIDSSHVGTLIFMLYADIVPNTCVNFLRLCQAKRGGYSGTPVHRIVKDCWIQCGGFGLKSIDLDCENFVVPHDRRGVLCMANDGRHVDCSTQFFVLLQPASWMAQKYVAFGQLIDGEAVLQKIESTPTWYESPSVQILIDEAGILNLECRDIMINKGTNEYIDGHIEELVALGNHFMAEIMEKTFLDIELRELELEEQLHEESEASIDEEKKNIRATQRFIRKKEEMRQLQKSQIDQKRPSKFVSEIVEENNDFDVEVYEYESEEKENGTPYQHLSLSTPSVKQPSKRLYYIPLTDVPYPGEVDSTYDLKKFLKGDYCLESDLQTDIQKKVIGPQDSYISDIYKFDNESDEVSLNSLESEEEREIRRYLKLNVDRVSFAGDVIKGIARGVGQFNIFEGTTRSELITDEELRRFRIQSVDRRSRDNGDKKVSISIPWGVREPSKIKRRQTGFVRMEDLEKIHIIQRLSSQDLNDSDESPMNNRKVRIAQSAVAAQTGSRPARRPTGFVKPAPLEFSDSDMEVRRQSVLTRLYENLSNEDDIGGPTLKEYRPLGETEHRNLLLTYSPNSRIKSDENTRDKYLRHSLTAEDVSYDEVMNLQHSKKVARKISSDYVKTIDQMEHKVENSIRSVEYAKNRPSMSVSQYQAKNLRYQQGQKIAPESKATHGVRLPGDTPLYSMSETSK